MISMDRNNHILGVAREMKRLSEERYPGDTEYQESMFLLGIVHDIGYEFTENPKDHARVGGGILKEQGYRYWKEVESHGDAETEYRSKELDMLNEADMRVDGKGRRVTIKERLEDIGYRNGYNSWQYTNSKRIVERLGK